MRLLCASNGLRSKQRPLVSAIHGQQRAYNAAVIGAGVTGLTAAWQLAQDPECSRITLYEKSARLGGWLSSETIPVEGGEVVFEYGPRTLRSAMPASLPLLYLVSNLGLFDQLITTSKRSPAALNRYIYYPDHLVRLPTPDPSLSLLQNLKNIFTAVRDEPLFEGLIPAILLEHTKPLRPPELWNNDESIAQFISRRFNRKVADNLVSAVMHGIYAGDIDEMSAQMILGGIRNLEDGGVLFNLLSKSIMGKKTRSMDDFLAVDAITKTPESVDRTQEINRVVKTASTFTFKRGTQQLVEGLIESLRASKKVNLQLNANITSMSRPEDSRDQIKIYTGNQGVQSFDHVISAIPASALSNILDPKARFEFQEVIDPETRKTRFAVNVKNSSEPVTETLGRLQLYCDATTVMVVNLYYKTPNLLPVDGFGYLIPRSIPYEQNPECGLGVIFASASSVGESPVAPYPTVSQDSAPGTKITIMFGGHYWDGWKKEDYPDHKTAVRMAQTMLERHLGIIDTPTVVRTRLQENAIPKYKPAHLANMYQLSFAAKREYHGRLVLAGNSFNGVGVGDCVRQGILAATHGVGRHTLQIGPGDWCPWKEFNYLNWDMKGGVTTAPVRLFESDV
ncbi:Protoporphyrinogen oxidase [Penicillium rolfsii]|nr:Protoporphyrinogen oxidase [Penicillium rolfsii]